MNLPLPKSLPRYYTANEVRILRDRDRRKFRANTILLVCFQIAVAGPIRIAADSILANPRLVNLAFIQPYVVPGMIVLVLLIWVFGIKVVFARREP